MAKKDKKSGRSASSGKGAVTSAKAKAAQRANKASKHPDSKAAKATALAPVSFSDALRVREGFVLAECDPRSTPAFDGDKAAGQKALAARAGEIGEFQERLYAESK